MDIWLVSGVLACLWGSSKEGSRGSNVFVIGLLTIRVIRVDLLFPLQHVSATYLYRCYRVYCAG